MENKILAIKGHPTRGNEIIEILEMLGGKNISNIKGNCTYLYYIGDNNFISLTDNYRNDFIIFTLEEFLEKYPYKVGDKVLLDNQVKIIKDVRWDSNNNEVVYTLEANINGIKTQYQVFNYDLQPYEEEIKAEDRLEIYADPAIVNDSKTAIDIFVSNESLGLKNGYIANKVEIKDCGILLKCVKNKPQYPKTYNECCNVLRINPKSSNDAQGYKADDIIRFQELLIARDAYWKIAGEEMGLSEPWKPSANDEGKTHSLYYNRYTDSLDKCEGLFESNAILDFPTKEMRDAFFENFKDLIENCKEFL